MFFLSNVSNASNRSELDSTIYNWNIRIVPYFWFVGFKGEIIRPPTISSLVEPEPIESREIDVNFMDISNSIKFALMLSSKFKSEYVVAQINITSLVLESEVFTPWEVLLHDNIVRFTYLSGDFEVGYRVIKTNKIELDALLGVKFVYSKIGLTSEVSEFYTVDGERDLFWIDPAIAVNFQYRPHPRIELVSYGDFGALIGSEYTYQFLFGANYIISKHFLISFGYRNYFVNYAQEEAIYNGRIDGYFARIGVQF